MKPKMTFVQALLPVLTMLVCFVGGSFFLEMGAPLLILVMLIAATIAGLQAKRLGHTWDDLQRATGQKIADVLPAILILLTIGMLIGTWVLSGTIPLLIYYGLRLVNPAFLVLTAFLVTAVMSLCTGTSWGSAGTIGVALMGMAVALEAPLAATAGAVVSGAYFGDKLSPLSDSTNISAIGANADLYAHIRHMLYTALPSFVVALVVYGLASRLYTAGDGGLPETARILLDEIDRVYALAWWALLPPVVVVVGMLKRIPPVIAMAASSVVAMGLGVALQGFSLTDALVAAVDGFHTNMLMSVAVPPEAVSDAFATLLNRGGLSSMVNTLLVIFSAFLLAAGLDVSGALTTLLNRLLAAVTSVGGLIAATMASGGLLISLTSHGGVTALIVGGLFQHAYEEQGLAPENLSRSIEDSVTIVEPLMPWTVSALFMASTVGVSTLTYLPWAVFCYGGPVFSLLYAALYQRTGFGIKRL